LAEWESTAIMTPVGNLGGDVVTRAQRAVEGIPLLAWALGESDFPRHDRKVDPVETAKAAGLLATDAAEWCADLKLRGRRSIRAARELLYDVHVRLRNRLSMHPQVTQFDRWVEAATLEPLGLLRAAIVAGADFAIGGRPVSGLADDVVRPIEWVTGARQRAAIWLCDEQGPGYWDWTVDT
jgi:hypothetical protein